MGENVEDLDYQRRRRFDRFLRACAQVRDYLWTLVPVANRTGQRRLSLSAICAASFCVAHNVPPPL